MISSVTLFGTSAARSLCRVACRKLSSATGPETPIITALLPSVQYGADLNWKEIHSAHTPVIIRGLAAQWPALADTTRCWANLQALKQRVDEDTVVPIEIGTSYMDKDLQKPHVGLGSMLDYLMLEKQAVEQGPRIYLAQHELSDIPVMRDDVVTPLMCTTTGKGCLYRSNIWFGGAKGTASPCHIDPFENLLCQVVGTKQVTLFAPALGLSHLYPAVGTVQANTSLVDMEKPNLIVHPLYREAVEMLNAQRSGKSNVPAPASSNVESEGTTEMLGGRGTLYPGDAVYVPFKWWHYFKTDEVSCSVNFWWL